MDAILNPEKSQIWLKSLTSLKNTNLNVTCVPTAKSNARSAIARSSSSVKIWKNMQRLVQRSKKNLKRKKKKKKKGVYKKAIYKYKN